MRRIIALSCAVPVLLAAVASAGHAAAAPARAVPAPAASPPVGDAYYTSAQLARGLPTRADLPAGYTPAGETAGSQSGYPVYGSGLCTGFPTEIWEPVSHASRAFTHTDGTTVRVSITAIGADRARQVVGHLSDAPAQCPAAGTKLALPDLGRTAAGLVTAEGQAVAIAFGNASAVFEETRGTERTRARFLGIVEAGAAKLAAIDGPSSVEQLKRGLLDVTDLPAGHRQVAGGEVTGGDWFTEYDCAGTLLRFDPKGTAVYRSFTTGKRNGKRQRATVRMAVASIGTPGLAQRVRDRLAKCPSVIGLDDGVRRTATALQVPSTDITTVGIRYAGRPAVARAIIEYRDWRTDVRITMTGYEQADAATVDKVVTAAMTHIFEIGAGKGRTTTGR